MTKVAAAPGSIEEMALPVRGSGRLNAGSLKEPTSTSLDSVRTMTRVVASRVGAPRVVGETSLRAAGLRGARGEQQRGLTHCQGLDALAMGWGRRVGPGAVCALEIGALAANSPTQK